MAMMSLQQDQELRTHKLLDASWVCPGSEGGACTLLGLLSMPGVAQVSWTLWPPVLLLVCHSQAHSLALTWLVQGTC